MYTGGCLQFTRYGLIEVLSFNRRYLYVYVNIEADDCIGRGGFFGQEVLFQKSVEDLFTEIEEIKPSLGVNVERLSTIAANLLTFYGLLKPGGK
jgi:hypothetical protein